MDGEFEYLGGLFYWDNVNNELAFYNYEVQDQAATRDSVQRKVTHVSDIITDKYDLEFKEDIDLIEKLVFRKKYRRKIGLHEEKIIVLQDIKDVVIFTANAKCMTTEFIVLLHKPDTDRFFRALIIYFQFFFQVWELLRTRREELERKIPLPNVKNSDCEDLSDMRSIIAKEYLTLLYALNAANKLNMQELDRKLAEQLIQFSTRMVWYALNKPLLVVIEEECDRLMRSDHYNKSVHKHALEGKSLITYTKPEKWILRGRTDIPQKRLVAQSAAAKEILHDSHDHRLLAIGQLTFPPIDERSEFFEKLYLIPEEEFEKKNVTIGILGLPRDNFDVMLKPKRKFGGIDALSTVNFNYNIPPVVYYSNDTIPSEYPTEPPSIQLVKRKSLLANQRKIWLLRLQNIIIPDRSISSSFNTNTDSFSI